MPRSGYTDGMPIMLALIVGAFAGYLPELLLGAHLSMLADFILGTMTGVAGYYFTLRALRNLRG